jgi:hypothetical protein
VAKTYSVQSPEGLIGCRGGFFAVFAAMAGVIFGVGFHWLIGVAVASAACCLAWIDIRSTTHEIRVADDGTVEFVGLRRNLRIAAQEIRVLERVRYYDEGSLVKEMRITHARGAEVLPDFDESEEFIADVGALNPGVELIGIWPAATR